MRVEIIVYACLTKADGVRPSHELQFLFLILQFLGSWRDYGIPSNLLSFITHVLLATSIMGSIEGVIILSSTNPAPYLTRIKDMNATIGY